MRKFLFVIILLLGSAVLKLSAQDMRSIFLNAPDDIFPLLTKNCRADLVDFIDAGMKAKVMNDFDGTSVLESIDDDYLLLATTASSTMQLKLLPIQNDTIICMVKSVKAEAVDSRIFFYDLNWTLLDGSGMFIQPEIEDFFKPDVATEKIADICDMYLVSLMLDRDDNSLVAEYTMPAYMSAEDAEKVTPVLRKLVYNWDGESFVIE